MFARRCRSCRYRLKPLYTYFLKERGPPRFEAIDRSVTTVNFQAAEQCLEMVSTGISRQGTPSRPMPGAAPRKSKVPSDLHRHQSGAPQPAGTSSR